MKVLIASDIHGSSKWAGRVKELFKKEKCDMLLLLGDILYHGPRNDLPNLYDTKKTSEILNTMKEKIVAIRGNCDAQVDQVMLEFPILQDSSILNIDGLNFFITHGHIYNDMNLPSFKDIDILLNGHTHIPIFKKYDNFTFVNPGSTSIPKGGSCNSSAIYENKEFKFYDLEDFNTYRKEKI